MEWFIGIGAIIAILLFRKQIGRLFNVGKAMADEEIKKAEERNAMALLQQTIDKAEDTVRTNRGTVIKAQAGIDGLTRQFDSAVNECGSLTERIRKYKPQLDALVASGQGDSEQARRISTQLTSWANELLAKQKVRDGLELSIATHRDSLNRALARIRSSKEEVDSARTTQKTLGVKLDLSKFDAQMAEAFSSLGQGDNPSESINAAVERVNRVIDEKLATASVIQATEVDNDFERQVESEMQNDAAQKLIASLTATTAASDAEK